MVPPSLSYTFPYGFTLAVMLLSTAPPDNGEEGPVSSSLTLSGGFNVLHACRLTLSRLAVRLYSHLLILISVFSLFFHYHRAYTIIPITVKRLFFCTLHTVFSLRLPGDGSHPWKFVLVCLHTRCLLFPCFWIYYSSEQGNTITIHQSRKRPSHSSPV